MVAARVTVRGSLRPRKAIMTSPLLSRFPRILPTKRRTVRTVLTGVVATGALALSGCQSDGDAVGAAASETVEADGSVTPVVLDTPRLSSADNFRDVAGITEAYAAGDATLRPGVVYRSNVLDLSDADLSTVESLGVGTVIDLRTSEEIAETPDRVPAGAEYRKINILGDTENAANQQSDLDLSTPEKAREMLRQANVQFVEDATMREGIGKVITAIAESDGPVLFHCTAGKDRAGWVAAVLQLASGVSREDVIANYTATNDYTRDRVAATVDQIEAHKGDAEAASYRVLLGVSPDFLEAGLDAMDAQYGGIDRYLTDGLNLGDETVDALRDKLVA